MTTSPTPRTNGAGAVRRLFAALVLGAVAGLASLALDELLMRWMLGHFIPASVRLIALYPGLGALVGVLFEAERLLVRRRPSPPALLLAVTLAVLYGLSLGERLAYTAMTLPVPVALAVAVGLTGYGVWIFVLRRVIDAGIEIPDGRSAALGLAALTTATVLAVNRNLVDRPLAPEALACDFGLVAGSLLAALLLGRSSPRHRVIAAGIAASLVAATLVVPGNATSPPPDSARPSDSPHLLLFCIDTLRQDVFQSVVEGTPEGRAFREALQGATWFSNNIATAPWTSPSVGSIMTGLYPTEHGFGMRSPDASVSFSLSDSAETLAEKLSEAGYRTEAIVTNPFLNRASGIARGFHDYRVYEIPTDKLQLPFLTVLLQSRFLDDTYEKASSVRRRFELRLADFAQLDQPIFVWLHFMDPHEPLHAHRDLSPDPAAVGLPSQERLYREEVRYVLRELTSVIDGLKRYRLWDNAVVAVISDHGEAFESDAHGKPLPDGTLRHYGHGHTLYDELVRVPLVIRPPGGLTGERRVDALTSNVDLHDTLADLMGLDRLRIGRDRVSLAAWLGPDSGAPEKARTYALTDSTSFGADQEGVRTATFKLIRAPSGKLADELYDLSLDPAEHNNLADHDPQRLAEMRELADFGRSRLVSAPGDGIPVEFDAETRKRLEALGYLN